ncbi:hypothetical protein CLOM_g19879 [Closterium sp. NIES-68]|nr:hypothetical protein CLOM_g19879 [Closterium sp. NIES-68]GJP60928.1 hypothetical protein CLOP_g18145 [Closterium sp. NIES-67]
MGSESSVRKFEKESMLDILRHIPAPVVIITAAYGEANDDNLQVRGMTCSSFTSVSLEPPFISVCLRKNSLMMQVLERSAGFGVHLLNEENKQKAGDFAKPHDTGKGPFNEAAGPWELVSLRDYMSEVPPNHAEGQEELDAVKGVPVLQESMAALVCYRKMSFDAGDHIILVGEVVATSAHDFHPLIYMNRHYHQLGHEV